MASCNHQLGVRRGNERGEETCRCVSAVIWRGRELLQPLNTTKNMALSRPLPRDAAAIFVWKERKTTCVVRYCDIFQEVILDPKK